MQNIGGGPAGVVGDSLTGALMGAIQRADARRQWVGALD